MEDDIDAAMSAIDSMLEVAEAHGMAAEVVLSFFRAAKAGQDVPESCEYALSEWDL